MLMTIHICKICNFKTDNYKYFWAHCKTIFHNKNEEECLTCVQCDTTVFKNIQSLRSHKYNYHNKINKKNKINTSNGGEIINEIKKNNDKNTYIIKEEIREVKNSVTKAITKATSLIRYLMKHHGDVPSITKIDNDKCINRLRLDYECPYNDKNKYSLQKTIIEQYVDNHLIDDLVKTILNLLNHKKPKLQQIYNTDYTRKNYIIKMKEWNQDVAGIKFTDYIIKPLLNSIALLLKEYREKELETVNTKKISGYEYEKFINQNYNTLKLESDIYYDVLVTPLLHKLGPYLRYLEEEIEELQKYSDIELMQKELRELEEIIKNSDNSDNDNYDSDSEFEFNYDCSNYNVTELNDNNYYDNDNYNDDGKYSNCTLLNKKLINKHNIT